MSGFTIVVILILVMLAALSIYLLAVDETELAREPGDREPVAVVPDDDADDRPEERTPPAGDE
jgi:hypothetical protein